MLGIAITLAVVVVLLVAMIAGIAVFLLAALVRRDVARATGRTDFAGDILSFTPPPAPPAPPQQVTIRPVLDPRFDAVKIAAKAAWAEDAVARGAPPATIARVLEAQGVPEEAYPASLRDALRDMNGTAGAAATE